MLMTCMNQQQSKSEVKKQRIYNSFNHHFLGKPAIKCKQDNNLTKSIDKYGSHCSTDLTISLFQLYESLNYGVPVSLHGQFT